MKKNTPFAHIILAIVFVLMNVIAFAVPTDKTEAFWIAYAFTVISFIVQPFVWKLAFGREKELKRRRYRKGGS